MLKKYPHIQFLGVNDDDLTLFEAQYPVTQGVSYNSYLLRCQQTAIIDSVDTRRCDAWLELAKNALKGRPLDYFIVQHMEPDHSGSLAVALEQFSTAKVVCSAKTEAMIAAFFPALDLTGRVVTVKEGDTLSLGEVTLSFVAAPMVHWPEVMIAFDVTDGILFSADAFGTFGPYDGCSEPQAWASEARRYYTNIVGKYGPSVQTLLKKLPSSGLNAICPLHGPVLETDLAAYISLYDKWSRYEPEHPEGVLVAYASIYGGTAQAAHTLAAMLRERGVEPVVELDLCRHHVSEAVSQTFRLGRMALCSATYDAGLFPAMYTFLHHLAMKGMRNRRVGLIENGSWAPLAAKVMTDLLAKMKGIEIVPPTVTIRSRMKDTDLPALEELATALSR